MATTIDLGKIRLQWKGDYSNATSYELLDVVKFKGDSYVFISTIAAANKTPDTTSEWDLMVSGGDQWSTGTSVPTGGNPGDMYLKTDDEKVYTNIAGSWGVVGDMGGSRWTSGTSAPSGGEDGDFYLKTDDEKVYERVSGSWVVKLDIGGGVWTSGTSVPTGGEAGDFYIKTDDEKIYENVAGTWTVKLDIGGGVWTSGTSNGTGGESGDWHINTTTKDIQENVSGTWTTRVNLSVSGTNLSDLANVPALDSGKFLTNDGTNTSWATVDTNAIANSAVTDAKISGMSASKLTGALPTISGANLTNLPGGGKVLQVVSHFITSIITLNSSSFATVISKAITPVAAGSTFAIWTTLDGVQKDATSNYIQGKLSRSGTGVSGGASYINTTKLWDHFGYYGLVSSETDLGTLTNVSHDNPSYTLGNTITYGVDARRYDGSGTILINKWGSSTSYILIMEIGA